jgi:hypothetical protein
MKVIESSLLFKMQVLLALVTLIAPLAFYADNLSSSVRTLFWRVVIGWDSLLHTSCLPIAAFTCACALFLASRDGAAVENSNRRRSIWISVLSLTFTVATIVASQLQVVAPGWIWNPFLLGTYKVYMPKSIELAAEGLCLDQENLCLTEASWKELSSGALSSKNAEDLKYVQAGVSFAKDEHHGLIINVMSRDTIDAIPNLRLNVEGLTPFFPKLSVVVFENDSKDGSREAFKKWAEEAEGYTVDVMECAEAVDCKFGESHRYDATEAKDYFKSSAIGKMAEYRQRMVDYVVGNPFYNDYSHMIALDLDIGVSLSPLGILHTLGIMPKDPVASSGRQVWPGSFGTITPPYDFSAFRAVETPSNQHIMKLHEKFCALMPPGDRWRNQCDAVSPMHMMLVLSGDWSGSEPYQVVSAFNGATLYPMEAVRLSGARYDVGADGQRCEHIGFNLGLKRPMYVNPKWDMHVSPRNPGGPTGVRALKNVVRIVFTPRISFTIFFQLLLCMFIFVNAIMTLAVQFWYPCARVFIDSSGIDNDTLLPLVDKLTSDHFETVRKRKYSDF